ncbi:MAG: YgiT-type zinc finger protein [Nitrospiraceae bacterium]
MKCHVCGSEMREGITDLPFKANQKTIVILKDLPIWQCERCSEYLLEDQVMAQVEVMIGKIDKGAELEIVRYAA